MRFQPSRLYLLAIPICMVGSTSGQIYRVNGALIAGTEAIQLVPGVDLSGWDLQPNNNSSTGAVDLSELDLTGANFSGANLWGANLTGSNFTDADFSNANLVGVDSTNVNFNGADLSGADLEKAFFQSSNFSNVNFESANFLGAYFGGGNFVGARFHEIDLSVTFFSDSNFANADLSNTNLSDVFIMFGSSYNQWTTLPEDFSVDGIDLSFRRSRTGDFDVTSRLNVRDIDLLSDVIRLGRGRGFAPMAMYDVTNDGAVDLADHRMWVQELKKTWYGDANLDGLFNSADLVAVFAVGQYEDTIEDNTDWTGGDWDADGDFNTRDLIAAFQDGGYDAGRRSAVANVPEPSTFGALVLGMLASLAMIRARDSNGRSMSLAS